MKLGCVPHSQLMRRNGIFRRGGVTFLSYNVVRFVCFTSSEFYLLPTSFLQHFPFLNSTRKFIDTLSRCGIRKRTFACWILQRTGASSTPKVSESALYGRNFYILSFQLLRRILGTRYMEFFYFQAAECYWYSLCICVCIWYLVFPSSA